MPVWSCVVQRSHVAEAARKGATPVANRKRCPGPAETRYGLLSGRRLLLGLGSRRAHGAAGELLAEGVGETAAGGVVPGRRTPSASNSLSGPETAFLAEHDLPIARATQHRPAAEQQARLGPTRPSPCTTPAGGQQESARPEARSAWPGPGPEAAYFFSS
jgi:hypothetical protein